MSNEFIGKFIVKHRDVIVPMVVGAIADCAVNAAGAALDALLNTQSVEKQFVVAEEEASGGKVQYVDKITYTSAIKNKIHAENSEKYDQYREELHAMYHDHCNCKKKKNKKK